MTTKRLSLIESIRKIAGVSLLNENRFAMNSDNEADRQAPASGMDDVASNQYYDDQADALSAQDEENDKNVDWASMQIDGIDKKDAPDFSDAYFSAGKYKDGTDISDEDLDRMSDRHADYINQWVHDRVVGESAKEELKSKAILAELAILKRLAGVPLNEAYGDDDEDEDVKAAEREIAKQKKAGGKAAKGWEQAEKAAKSADADKDLENAETKPAAKAEPKVEAKPAAVEPVATAEAAPAARAAFAKAIRAVLAQNRDATAADIKKYCADHNVKVLDHIHSHLSRIRKGIKVTECYILVHPQMSSFVLAENTVLNRYQWIDANDTKTTLDTAVFETEAAAKEVAQYVKDYRSQATIVTKVDLSVS